jgi:hypothetical protein
MRQRDVGLVAAEWVGRTASRIWAMDAVRGVLLLLYYLALIFVLIRIYGTGVSYTPPPYIYQGF